MTLLKSLTLWLEDRNASATMLPVAVEPPTTAPIETHHPDAAHLLAVLERIAELQRHAGKAGEVQTSAWRELAVRSEALRAALGTTTQSMHQGLDVVMQQQAAIEQHVETTATRVNDVMAEFCQIIDTKAKETVQGLQVIEALAQELFFVGINAAIQAAQAGEAGRAFSVVANQIRHMAGKTLENTRAVRQLLDLAPVLADMAQRRQETCTMMTQVSGDIHAASDRVRTTFANIQAGLGHIGDNNSVMNDMLEISQDALRRQTVKVSQSQTLTEALGSAARATASYSQIATSHGVRVDTGYDRLEVIVARGVLRVAVEPNFVGLSFRARSNESLRGLDIDYAEAYAAWLGVRCEFIEYPWDQCPELLAMGKTFGEPEADVFWSALMPSVTYDGIAFSDSYTYLNFVLARRAGDERIRGVADLAGKVLGSTTDPVLLGSLAQHSVTWSGAGRAGNIKLANLVTYTDQSRIHDCLADGVVDAFLIDEPIYWWACNGADSPWRGRIEIINAKMSRENMYYAVGVAAKPSSRRLLQSVNEFIRGFSATTERERIEKQWKGQATPGQRSYRDEEGALLGEADL